MAQLHFNEQLCSYKHVSSYNPRLTENYRQLMTNEASLRGLPGSSRVKRATCDTDNPEFCSSNLKH